MIVPVLTPSAATAPFVGCTDTLSLFTTGVNVIACDFVRALIFATTLTVSAVLLYKSTDTIPEAFVVPVIAVNNALPVVVNVTVRLVNGEPFTSRTVAVNLALLDPFALKLVISLLNASDATDCSNVIAVLVEGLLFSVNDA